MLPIPFTLTFALFIVAFLISKLQYTHTYFHIALYSILGPLEEASIILTCFSFLQIQDNFTIKVLFFGSLAVLAFLNILAFIVQTPVLHGDKKFRKWYRKGMKEEEFQSNKCFFHGISLLSILASYKFKMILFSRLFNFDGLKCQLQSKQKFKIFNLMSFIGLIPQVIVLYCSINIISNFSLIQKDLLIFIDNILMVSLNMIFSVVIVWKSEDFFQENVGGMVLNRVYNMGEDSMQSGVIMSEGFSKNNTFLPEIMEQEEYIFTIQSKRHRKMKQLKQPQISQSLSSLENIIQQDNQDPTPEHSVPTSKHSEQTSEHSGPSLQHSEEEEFVYPTVLKSVQSKPEALFFQEIENIIQISQQVNQSSEMVEDREQWLQRECGFGQLGEQVPIQLPQPQNHLQIAFLYPLKPQTNENNLQNIHNSAHQQSNQHNQHKAPSHTAINTSPYLQYHNTQHQSTHTKLSDYLKKRNNTEQQLKPSITQNQAIKYDYHPQDDSPQTILIKNLTKTIDITNNYQDVTLKFKRPKTSNIVIKRAMNRDDEDLNKMNKSTITKLQYHLNDNHAESPINKSHHQFRTIMNHPISSLKITNSTQMNKHTSKSQQMENSGSIYGQKIMKNRVMQRLEKCSKIVDRDDDCSQREGGNRLQIEIMKKRYHKGQISMKKPQVQEKQTKNDNQNQLVFKTKNHQIFNKANPLWNHLHPSQLQSDSVPRKPMQMDSSQLLSKLVRRRDSKTKMRSTSQESKEKNLVKWKSIDRRRVSSLKKGSEDLKSKSSLQRIYLQKLQKLMDKQIQL